jgi:putative ABC transport system permease protein
MEQIYDTALAPRRSQLILLGSFAGIALALSVLGVYGAFTYAGASRSREIAIRVALGASQTSILQLVLRRTLLIIAIGISIGVGLTVFAERIIRGSLYGVSPFDPGLYIEVTALLASAAFICSLVPAFRASRADPLPVLREQ